MRSPLEGFKVTRRVTEILPYAVLYYGVEIARFDSYADCVLHVVHWSNDVQAFAYVLNEELVVCELEAVAARVEARDRDALVERQRR